MAVEMADNTVQALFQEVFRPASEPSNQGRSFVPVTIVRVRSEWLAFMAAQIALSIVFRLAIVVQTLRRGVDVVKNSAVATVLVVPASDKAAMKDFTGHVGIPYSRAPVEYYSIGILVKKGGSWRLALVWAQGGDETSKRDPDQLV